jgi:hypothetical protein
METVKLPKGRFVEGSLPLYQDLSLLTAERHGVAALLDAPSFAFAAGAPTVPLTVDEFEQAALDYPIVFVGPSRRAFAVTGLQQDRNPFVLPDGSYRGDAYVPAYLRRYPFVLVQDPDQSQWVLAVDEYSTRLAPLDEPGARPLFVDGAPGEAVREAVGFCEAYANAERRTEAFAELLDELDLFEVREAHYQGEEGAPVLLLGYAAIDRARFEALDDVAIARLRAIGALGPVHAHLLSQANWERLSARTG